MVHAGCMGTIYCPSILIKAFLCLVCVPLGQALILQTVTAFSPQDCFTWLLHIAILENLQEF